MKIWHSPYQLVPKSVLNSRVKARFRKGALLRIRFEDGKIGFADLCPFSEMGDQPLELELKHLLQLKPSTIGARSLHFARVDAEARAEGRSLYSLSGERRIKNHFLIHDILKFDLSRVAKLESSGYSEVKVKMGRELAAETEKLDQLCARSSHQLKLRLDFNASLSRDRFVDWFEKHQSWLRPRVEFFEDPFTYDSREWQQVCDKWNLTFALDFAPMNVKIAAEGAAVLVIKPAVEDEQKIIAAPANLNKKFVFTQYLDFPVGQMSAFHSAELAARALGDRLLTCGLQQHDVYEPLTFQDAIKNDGPYIIPPEGLGIGFDKHFEKQQWIELN